MRSSVRVLFRWMKVAAIAGSLALATACSQPATLSDEEANKQLVLDFYAALNEADATGTTSTRAREIIEQYISPDYVQHAAAFSDAPGQGSGRDRLISIFESMPAMPGPVVAPETLAVMAEGDRVMLLTTRETPDPASGQTRTMYIFNMFRVADGKLVEHWDGSQPPSGPAAPGGAAGALPAGPTGLAPTGPAPTGPVPTGPVPTGAPPAAGTVQP